MKRIIGGKKYDTETAKFLASWGNDLPVNDFSFWKEDLYIKKTEEYFLNGYGGPMSKYSKVLGYNGRCGGDEIIPITEQEAKRLAEKYLDGDQYEEIFGSVEE